MMRWGLTKAIWERCRFTTTDLIGNAALDATSLFLTVGTTVPENVYRHVYGLILNSTGAAQAQNQCDVYHVPDGAKGTQYFLKDFDVAPGGGHGGIIIPDHPDPLTPLFPLEGGSKLYAMAGTASVRVTVLYWDDILTGVESA